MQDISTPAVAVYSPSVFWASMIEIPTLRDVTNFHIFLVWITFWYSFENLKCGSKGVTIYLVGSNSDCVVQFVVFL